MLPPTASDAAKQRMGSISSRRKQASISWLKQVDLNQGQGDQSLFQDFFQKSLFWNGGMILNRT